MSSDGHKFPGRVYVASMAAEDQRVPGSGTSKGRRAIVELMSDTLDRVRSSILERTTTRRHA